MDQSLYLADIATITTAQVRQFLTDLIEEQLLTENLTVELKTKRHEYNVAEAVCALVNTEGGLVLVGVDESGGADDGWGDGVLRLVDLVDRAMLDDQHRAQDPTAGARINNGVDHGGRSRSAPACPPRPVIHDVDEQRVPVSQFEINRFDERSSREVLQAWLTTLLLDDGVRDAE